MKKLFLGLGCMVFLSIACISCQMSTEEKAEVQVKNSWDGNGTLIIRLPIPVERSMTLEAAKESTEFEIFFYRTDGSHWNFENEGDTITASIPAGDYKILLLGGTGKLTKAYAESTVNLVYGVPSTVDLYLKPYSIEMHGDSTYEVQATENMIIDLPVSENITVECKAEDLTKDPNNDRTLYVYDESENYSYPNGYYGWPYFSVTNGSYIIVSTSVNEIINVNLSGYILANEIQTNWTFNQTIQIDLLKADIDINVMWEE
jgi:hypothetical protein